jgi:hypothetical protein
VRPILACTLLCAAAAALIAAGQEPSYRARAFVIQVPSALGGERGLELARSDRVLRSALAFSRVDGVTVAELRGRSKSELTSRLDFVFTVEAPRRQEAAALATGYAKAFRRAIPDDEGLPVRGRGAAEAQPRLGLVGWTLLGGVLGLGLGTAFTLLRDGRRRRAGRPLTA